MDRLIIASHGKYGKKTDLNAKGRKQMEKLSQYIKKSLNSNFLMVLAASTLRAAESAWAIKSVLGIGYEERTEFGDSQKQKIDFKNAYDFIRSKEHQTNIMVVVTNPQFVALLTGYFAKKLGFPVEFYPTMCGEAWDIDFKKSKIKKVPK